MAMVQILDVSVSNLMVYFPLFNSRDVARANFNPCNTELILGRKRPPNLPFIFAYLKSDSMPSAIYFLFLDK